jgi:hypothetical protein
MRNELEERALDGPEAEKRLQTMPLFKASAPFICDFRCRSRLALRKPSLKGRCHVNEEAVAAFISRVGILLDHVPAERILNLDETNWRSVSAGFLTWARGGAESVLCVISNDEKEGITAIAAVNARGQKLPLTIIGKGKIPRCLTALDLPPDVWATTSESGWTTRDVICHYFKLLRNKLFPDGHLVLLFDTYSAHRASLAREAVEQCGIELMFIPPGCTDRLQPLDLRIFGVLKSYARQLWRTQYHSSHGGKTSRTQMAKNLIDARDGISPDIFESAWAIYRRDWVPYDSEDRDGEYRPDMRRENLGDLI